MKKPRDGRANWALITDQCLRFESKFVNTRRFTVWCNNDFTAEQESERDFLVKGVGSHRLLMFERNDDGQDGESREALQVADIAFGYPDAHSVKDNERLLWVQLHTAGYTSFDHPDIKQTLIERGTILTNSSAVYDEPCAQHLLAMILAFARGLPFAQDAQRGNKSWQMHALRPTLRLLNEQTVLILGFGAIAKRLVQLLQPLQVNIIAVRREIKGDESVRMLKASDVDKVLPFADHIVNILPANEQTNNFLNAQRLAGIKGGAILYNIGRGTTVDQNALMKELRAGRLGAAYLDVTDPEPLPPNHLLWETPNCFITPHIGGGHHNEKERQVKHFLDNLRRFEQGEVLLNRLL